MKKRNLTYGEESVGLTFDKNNDPFIDDIKIQYAKILDMLHSAMASSSNKKRFYGLLKSVRNTTKSAHTAIEALSFQY